jgi:quercetin dioxygenase-like cupin family protein
LRSPSQTQRPDDPYDAGREYGRSLHPASLTEVAFAFYPVTALDYRMARVRVGLSTGEKMANSMLNRLVFAALLSLLPLVAAAQTASTAPKSSRKPLMSKDLPDFPGKEATIFIVEYPPGTNNPPHRHNGHVFLHVLEGQLNAQVKGGELVVLNPGSTYYESPADIHIVSRNPSSTVPAKAMVFLIHDKGAALSTPVRE